MSSEVIDSGLYKQEHDSVVHFRFEDVFDLQLDGLNHQNVLSCPAWHLNLSIFRRRSRPSCMSSLSIALVCPGHSALGMQAW